MTQLRNFTLTFIHVNTLEVQAGCVFHALTMREMCEQVRENEYHGWDVLEFHGSEPTPLLPVDKSQLSAG